MKKITFVLALALVSSVGFAQNKFVTAKEMGDSTAPTVIYETQNSALAPCEHDVQGAAENGWGPTDNDAVIWADDFVVNQNEVFSVNQIGINMLLQPGAEVDEANIFFFEDTGGNGPGPEFASLMEVEVVSSDVVGEMSGFNITRLVFDIDPIDFVGSSSEDIVYWVGMVVSYSGTQAFFEITHTVNTPNSIWLYDADEDMWIPGGDAFADPNPPADLVMTVSGDCNALSVDSYALSQVAVYPNPTTGILNVQTPSSVDVSSVALFDILGKQVVSDYNNGTINMSNLSQGIYLLKVETSAGTLTQKIVKQ